MAEPSTTTTAAIAAGMSALAFIPLVNGDALLGAVLGAALFATTKKNLKPLARLGTLLLSTGFGYYISPEVMQNTFIDSEAMSALVASMFSLPIALKLMQWVEETPIADIIKKTKGGL